ncbi:MAG: GntR family transcriptional regulator [Actinomycetota bacterium]
MRRVIYREIAASLREGIESGEYTAGELLPSEAALCATFGASRVTVRKALELLRDEGLVASRQGFGWLVAGEPLTQSLDSLVSIERQLAQLGRPLRREVTDFGFIDTPAQAAVLGPRVLQVGRLNLVDELPFARIMVWCREDLATDLSRAQVTNTSFLDLLGQRPHRALQTIGAHAVPCAEAELLAVPQGSPALLVRRTTYDADGAALLMSEHWFPGHLTEFVAELTTNGQPGQPGNELRLVADA